MLGLKKANDGEDDHRFWMKTFFVLKVHVLL